MPRDLLKKISASVLIFWLVFTAAALYLFCVNKHKLSDTVFFGGDSWEYQSLGVNLSLGHGFQTGKIAPLGEYKFSSLGKARETLFYPLSFSGDSPAPETLYGHFMKGGEYSFYRVPGYPFFLAFIYKVFGIHPIVVKIIQILLLAFTAAMLPVAGRYYWANAGLGSGLLASTAFIVFYAPDPTRILTEPLIIFSLCVLMLLLIFWEKRASELNAALLALAAAASVLIKGLNIFLPFLILWCVWRKADKPRRAKLVFIYIALAVLPVFFWSLYASVKLSRPVALSTHQDTLILDSNNENTLVTGEWNPAWRKQGRSSREFLYNRGKAAQMPVLGKLSGFLSANAGNLPLALVKKIRAAFKGRTESAVAVILVLLYYAPTLFYARREKIERIFYFPAICLIDLFLIVSIFYGNFRFLLPFMPFFLLPAFYLILSLCGLLFRRISPPGKPYNA
jgi:4-amino-4-deoxy-L-arabinose transferase-like glycosyltransferase